VLYGIHAWAVIPSTVPLRSLGAAGLDGGSENTRNLPAVTYLCILRVVR
jgi:hypothetical protein